MKAFSRIAILAFALAALAWLFLPVSEDVLEDAHQKVEQAIFVWVQTSIDLPESEDFRSVLMAPLAVWLMFWAAAVIVSERRVWRVSFWTIAVWGWFAVFVCGMVGWEDAGDSDKEKLVLSFGLAIGVAYWRAWRTRVPLTLRGLGEASVGVVLLAALIGACVLVFEARTRAMIEQARARWAAIGLPLEKFDHTLPTDRENAGSEATRWAFREVIEGDFYFSRKHLGFSPKAHAINTALGSLGKWLPKTDDVALHAESAAVIAPCLAKLDVAYERILAAEPPRWERNSFEVHTALEPNYANVRTFFQFALADALRLLAEGDLEKAAQAIAACRRIEAGLRENPAPVAPIAAIVLGGSFAHVIARLPPNDDGFAIIRRDAAELQERLVAEMRWQSWSNLRSASETWTELGESGTIWGLPPWASSFLERPVARRSYAVRALASAEHALILRTDDTRRLPDLGASQHDAVYMDEFAEERDNPYRWQVQLYLMLLRREQAEVIRGARAQWIAGRGLESRDSVVFPGLRWELAPGAAKDTITLRLAGMPPWLAKSDAPRLRSWLLPLDGKVSWQFKVPASAEGK